MPRKAGIPNRNYPPLRLSEALKVPKVIQDQASGMPVSRLTLAELLGTTPGSSTFAQLVASSRLYGLTTGGINADQFVLSDLGGKATDDDTEARSAALKAAVMKVAPFRTFFQTFSGKKVPGSTPFKEFLINNAEVPAAHADACMKHILADAETAGLVREIRSAKYIDLAGTPADPAPATQTEDQVDEDLAEELTALEATENGKAELEEPPAQAERPSAIFVGGRKGKSLDQLTKILDEYKIPYKLAEDEPHGGRPISQKVADTIRECGAAIIVFTPDEELRDLDGNPVFRPSQNVVHELGAAGMQYGNRIVIFREETVSLASNYSDIGHITFKKDELSAKGIELFRELIQFGLVTVTVGAA